MPHWWKRAPGAPSLGPERRVVAGAARAAVPAVQERDETALRYRCHPKQERTKPGKVGGGGALGSARRPGQS